MPWSGHPAVVNVLDHLRGAGQDGLRVSYLVELLDRVLPHPPPIVVLRQLVDDGYATASPAPATTESILVITDEGQAVLAAAKNAGAWVSQGVTVTPRKVLTEAGIAAFLRSVEHGEVTLTPDLDPNEVYAGVVPYSASNGWHIAIFNDCNQWDYIEWVEADGEWVTYEEIDREMRLVDQYEPSTEIAEAAYKIPRVTTKRPSEPENLDADVGAFAQVHEVLNGKRRLRLDGTASKMLRIMLGRDTDTVITPERFVVHFGPQKQRLPFRYFRRLAPRMMSELLERGAVHTVGGPVVIGLPSSSVPKVPGAFPEWSYEPKLVWVVPGADVVKVIVRKSPERWTVPVVQPIPVEGPLALRELPEWAPREVYREFVLALPCPRCCAPATRYREIRDALVCLKCGRSFEHAGLAVKAYSVARRHARKRRSRPICPRGKLTEPSRPRSRSRPPATVALVGLLVLIAARALRARGLVEHARTGGARVGAQPPNAKVEGVVRVEGDRREAQHDRRARARRQDAAGSDRRSRGVLRGDSRPTSSAVLAIVQSPSVRQSWSRPVGADLRREVAPRSLICNHCDGPNAWSVRRKAKLRPTLRLRTSCFKGSLWMQPVHEPKDRPGSVGEEPPCVAHGGSQRIHQCGSSARCERGRRLSGGEPRAARAAAVYPIVKRRTP